MKKVILKIFSFLLIIFNISALFFLVPDTVKGVKAQTPTPTAIVEEIGIGETQEFSDPAFKINLTLGDQEYPSSRFSLKFEISSIIESGKIGVDWIYPKNYFKIEGAERDRIDSLVPGQNIVLVKYFTPISDKPSAVGTIRKVEFGARVLGLIPDLRYLSSTKISTEFNNEWEITPLGQVYQTEKTVKTILTTLFWIVIIVAAGVLLVIGVRKFMDYLNKDDIER